ncbi:SMI1 / KNR4 family (SUKH-1) [Kordia sp. SMS9]|uniref:SMI1/KNR4 family protein n=1 Tax=Kordia sp. SMS9 TaxID=2282170 RepID=UPI000E0E06E3|nr:SMI1/KNR4 family protein [Kordia sp. SMS9]AXG71666.1 SMI1 / KNR4 family (SUKH-1) [Kordia sp. SMS9]
MKPILETISLEMIRLAEFDYSEAQLQAKWFGNEPATNETIQKVEEKLKVSLPEDYKEFLSITNGFHAFSDVEPTFHPVETIDYLRTIDREFIKIWRETGNEEIADVLAQSIVVAGMNDEQLYLLIPPSEECKNWRYWKFASWIPGEEAFDSLKHYFKDTLSYLKGDD